MTFTTKRCEAPDYRRVYREVGKAYGVEFVFATAQATIEALETTINHALFGIFDITTWDPNVALGLGIARGKNSTTSSR